MAGERTMATPEDVTTDQERRLREALLLLNFSPEELATLSPEELRILAATPYTLPPADPTSDPLRPHHYACLNALREAARRPRGITRARQHRRRRR